MRARWHRQAYRRNKLVATAYAPLLERARERVFLALTVAVLIEGDHPGAEIAKRLGLELGQVKQAVDDPRERPPPHSNARTTVRRTSRRV
jgi:hypothetical protein